jgi:hypothetical protein
VKGSRIRRFEVAGILLAGLIAGQAFAIGGKTRPPREPVEAATSRGLNIRRVSHPPTLEDFLSMHPSAHVAGEMTRVTGFIQRDPDDGRPATQRTDVYLGYDQSKLYAVFVCFDTQPKLVRAHMARREDVFADDSVELMLDTFDDQRRGYAFIINPYGIQWDATWSESGGFDSSWDAVWDSHGRRTSQGYVAYMAIPFKSLRFPAEKLQTWGIILNRYIPRLNENAFWPRLSRDISGRLNQAAEMHGLESISPGRNIQFIPYFMAQGGNGLVQPTGAAPAFQSQNKVTAGLDSKLVIKDSLVLDTTIKPDFSQVESDDPQVTVNQRYEVFFPEKRPFFLENANYFDTPYDLVFTRRIVAPDYGARLTGKLDHYAIGALFADDRSAGENLAPADPGMGKKAYYTVLRASRDLMQQSSIGVIYTAKSFDGYENRVAGIDGKLKFGERWNTSFQAVDSSTQNADGTSAGGPAYEGYVSRTGANLNFGGGYNDIAPNFHTDVGFVQRTDIRNANGWVSYRFRPEDSTLMSWGPSFSYKQDLDHTGLLLDRSYYSDMSWSLKPQTSFGVRYQTSVEQLRPQDFDTLTAPQMYDRYSTGVWSSVGMSEAFSFGGSFNWQERINYVPAAGPPVPANGNTGNFWFTYRPVSNVRLDNSYILDRVLEPATGQSVYDNHIVQSKMNWQFNRELSVRLIAQYNAVLANPSVSSLQSTKAFNTDFLFSYLLHPGTAIYLGYNTDMANIDPLLATDASGNLLRTRSGFMNDSRQFFIKVSYLFRR